MVESARLRIWAKWSLVAEKGTTVFDYDPIRYTGKALVILDATKGEKS